MAIMKITVLGSGSKGNATLIDFENKKILIDVGFTSRTLKNKLESINVDPKDIDYVFITHNHSDHIVGLKSFLKKYKPELYISERVALSLFNDTPYEKINYYSEEILIDDIYVKVINTSHDAIDSKGFVIERNNTSVVYITDTGYIHQRNLTFIENKSVYIIESNHDTEMLRKGRYPDYLQRRILSNVGHLSNDLCGSYLSKLIGPNTKKIVLAHLSEENNTPELAKETVVRILNDNNIDIEIECAKQDEILEVVQ